MNRHFNSNDLKKLYEFKPHTYNINGREKVSEELSAEDEKVHDSVFRDLLKVFVAVATRLKTKKVLIKSISLILGCNCDY